MFDPNELKNSLYSDTENPMGIGRPGHRSWPSSITRFLVLAVTMVASAASLVIRFRRAGPVEREQVKWLAAAAAVSASIYFLDLCISAVVSGPRAGAGVASCCSTTPSC